MKKIFNILLLLALALTVQANVTATIDSIQMVVGEQTRLHLSATVKEGQKVVFPQWKAQQQLTPGIEIVDLPVTDTIAASDGFITITQHLTLTAWEDSLYYIPQLKVKVNGKEELSKSLALKVLTVEVDTLHPNQYFGPRDVQDNPFLWAEWAKVLWLTFLLIVLYVLGWLAYIRLKSKKPITLKVRIRKIIPPHQKALSSIQGLKQEVPAMADSLSAKTYYTQLTDILRTYMQERFGFNAMEMTSAEIIERIEGSDEKEVKLQELATLLQTADLVKFAKYTAGMSENDRNLMSAIDFINQTKQENVPTEERIEPTVTEQEKQTMRMRLSLKWAVTLLVIAAAALTGYVCWLLFELRG